MPAAGQASRIQPLPCSKELLPIGIDKLPDGRLRPKVVAQGLLAKFKVAGVAKVYVVLRNGKWDIPAYFGDGSMVGMNIAYLLMNLPYGVPYTLDQAYPFVKDAKVMVGFPDMLFGPDDAFACLDATLTKTQADIAIGLFPPKDARQVSKCDMVAWDEKTGRVEQIVVKPKRSDLDRIWIIAVWMPVFSRFMHDYLKVEHRQRLGSEFNKEIHLGDVVQRAIEGGLNVQGHLFPRHRFVDIGSPGEFAGLFRHQ